MEGFDKELEQYGIFVKSYLEKKIDLNKKEITLNYANIKRINFNILKSSNIEKLIIKDSEIEWIYFFQKNIKEGFKSYLIAAIKISLYFENCTFKEQINAKWCLFDNKIFFLNCIFEKTINFSVAEFKSKVYFNKSKFKSEVYFIQTQFLAKQYDKKTIENNFKGSVFCSKLVFNDVKFNAKVNFANSRFEDDVIFTGVSFLAKHNNEIPENNFEETIFLSKVFFSEINFNSKTSFALARFNKDVMFIQIKFLSNQKDEKIVENDFGEVKFLSKVLLSDIEFKGETSFTLSRFEDMVLFRNISFTSNKICFSHTEFNNIKIISDSKQNVKQSYFFEHSIFKGITNFQDLKIKNLEFRNTVFDNIVVFDNTILGDKPKFTNCTFSNQFNIKHDYIQYDYNELKEKNKNTYDEFLNFRDLFRKLKSNRIAHHNLIDASELRAQELYARELELKHKKIKNLKDTIEQWQLFFYRKLCDHHTDLVLNAKWLIISIGMFACMLFMIKLYKHGLCILNAFNFYGLYFSALGSFILSALALFRCIDTMKAFVSINAIIIFWVICYKPKLIFGIANLIGDNNYNAFENLLITLYTLIVGLIIFSLQKTARKNTIIPN
ncbi:hypothetical protein [Campylobacter lari]|uniref:hypothetical protein n=1 Tax=Campylobacter lari TaxID=201 RepID=UPI00057DD979|nr:hypothetical protein [Campylobacter lari]AJD04601.1 putative membrane protein [Campylobacter lari RM16701]